MVYIYLCTYVHNMGMSNDLGMYVVILTFDDFSIVTCNSYNAGMNSFLNMYTQCLRADILYISSNAQVPVLQLIVTLTAL